MPRLCIILVLAICSLQVAFAQGNTRAQEEIKAFVAKFEEGDALFHQRQYADAAKALAAAHELYLRAERRDSEVGRTDVKLNPAKFAALRYYGYGFGSNASLAETPAGVIEGSAAGLDAALRDMWQDAAILSGANQIPVALFSDAPLVDLDEGRLNSVISSLYGPISTMKLPVPDDEWRNVVLWSRRAQLIVEYALQKHPEWKTGTLSWSRNNDKLQHTGDEALADIKAKLAEAEPEYAKVVADFKNATPKRITDFIEIMTGDLDKAIAGVKKNGWVEWRLANEVFIRKDYLSSRRKNLAPLYVEEGKTMPPDALKPVEDKIAELKAAVAATAPKWKFPTGKPRNSTIEAKAAAAVKSRLAGASIIKTALDSGEWIITKNDLGIPSYRSMGVLVLAKVPNQTHSCLIFLYLRQNYAGGGTYSPGGTVGEPYDIRFQSGG